MFAPAFAPEKGRSYRLLRTGEKNRSAVSKKAAPSGDEASDRARPLLCGRCGYPITTRDRQIAIDGAFEHTFAKPHGYIYRIGCFRDAPGCRSEPESTARFSWFAGYAWALTGCAQCGNHLGWRYLGERDRFFGLVLERLADRDPSGG